SGLDDVPPLVFSNSLGTNLHMWDGQMDQAERHWRVVRYDQRGHGGSDAPGGDYALDRLGLDVIDLLAALDIEKTAFCGLSMGGMTGLWLAINHPGRFTRMALCNTSAFLPPADLWNSRIGAVSESGMAAIDQAVMERWFTEVFRAAQTGEAERIRQMILTTDPAGYAGCCAAIRDMDQRDDIGAIELPLLVVIGAHDPATPPDHGELIAATVRDAQSVTLDAAHLSNIEQREAFNRAVFGFLAGSGGDSQ
ncbi:MAG TPA: 3-oxoadipate enol-lactonase, partial [Afifellaceae bacterium]|nr:3-oxoadipate enol-lactonase [Afifellaceae bacterium]